MAIKSVLLYGTKEIQTQWCIFNFKMVVQVLPGFSCIKLHVDGALCPRWERNGHRLQNVFLALVVTDNTRSRALLLHYTWDVFDIFEILPNTEGEDYFQTVLKCLTDILILKHWVQNIQVQTSKAASHRDNRWIQYLPNATSNSWQLETLIKRWIALS